MVVDRTLYDILGVDPSATPEAITKAYRKKSLEHHPDRGGNVEMMQKVIAAKEILTDPEKRKLYDQYGLAEDKLVGESQDFPFAGTPWGALIESLRLWAKNQGARRSKNADIEYELIVSLEDLYLGATKPIDIERNILCNHCKGTGCNNGIQNTCRKCNGKGVETSISQQGSTVQYSQKECSACNGQGDIIDDHNRCISCSGKKVIREKHTFDVNIPRGSQDEETIEYSDQGNQIPNAPFGTLYITLNQEHHPVFRREKDNLIINMDINLNETSYEFRRLITLLDNRQILIKHLSEEPIQSNSYWIVKDYGMPKKDTDTYGDLILHFNIQSTEKRSSTNKNQRIKTESNANQCYTEVQMIKYDQYEQNVQNNSYSNDYNDHNNDHENPKRFKQESRRFPCNNQ